MGISDIIAGFIQQELDNAGGAGGVEPGARAPSATREGRDKNTKT